MAKAFSVASWNVEHFDHGLLFFEVQRPQQ